MLWRTSSKSLLALVLLAAVLVLTSCISGEAKDQQAIETSEANRPDVLESVQKTTIAERFMKPTGTPEPTVTPIPAVNTLALASSVNQDGSPLNQIERVSGFNAGTIYACVQIAHVSQGQTVIGVWSAIGGSEVARSEQQASSAAPEQWVALSWQNGGGLPSGMYAITVYVDQVDIQHKVSSLAFRVN